MSNLFVSLWLSSVCVGRAVEWNKESRHTHTHTDGLARASASCSFDPPRALMLALHFLLPFFKTWIYMYVYIQYRLVFLFYFWIRNPAKRQQPAAFIHKREKKRAAILGFFGSLRNAALPHSSLSFSFFFFWRFPFLFAMYDASMRLDINRFQLIVGRPLRSPELAVLSPIWARESFTVARRRRNYLSSSV